MRIAADQQSSKRGRGAVSPMSPKVGDVMLAEDLQTSEDAFLDTADPRFCYLDPLRRHASGRLLSGLYEGDGLFLLPGRAGIGKTALLRHLSEQLKALDGVLLLCSTQVFACRSGTTLADVFVSCETRLGLGQSAAVPLKATKKLREFVESDRSPVLLLDDADLLGDDVLEAVVTLTGLQAADRRLLSAVLTGHPDIAARVAAITGDAGAQASDRAMELQPMVEPDVARMIRHRLRAAGWPEETFGADAIAAVVRHSGGVPSAVVRTCRRALQFAESRSRETVTAEIVVAALGEEGPGAQRELPRPAAAPVASPVDRPPPSEFGAPRPQPTPVEPRVALSSSVAPKSAFPAPGEPRSPSSAPVEPKTRTDVPARQFPEPSLRREQHASIPEVTLGHQGRGRHDSPPTVSREAAWWSPNTVHSERPDRTTADHPLVGRRRRAGGRRWLSPGLCCFCSLRPRHWRSGWAARASSPAAPSLCPVAARPACPARLSPTTRDRIRGLGGAPAVPPSPPRPERCPAMTRPRPASPSRNRCPVCLLSTPVGRAIRSPRPRRKASATRECRAARIRRRRRSLRRRPSSRSRCRATRRRRRRPRRPRRRNRGRRYRRRR